MLGRLAILLVALQLVVSGAFAYAITAEDHCAGPAVVHAFVSKASAAHHAAGEHSDDHDAKLPLDPLNCAGSICGERLMWTPVMAIPAALRADELMPLEPRLNPQSVVIGFLRPPPG